MNADSSYVKYPEALALYKDPLSKFLIDFDADTTSKLGFISLNWETVFV